MGNNPIVLFVRFLLEIAALISIGMYGWAIGSKILSYILAVGLPLIAAILWGVFAVPGDPSRSGKAPVPIPGTIRLILELLIFGFACFCLIYLGYNTLGIILVVIVVLLYIISYDRFLWLINKR